jgi:hypothetical protein
VALHQTGSRVKAHAELRRGGALDSSLDQMFPRFAISIRKRATKRSVPPLAISRNP